MVATAAIVGGIVAGLGTTASYFEQKKTARKVERKQEKANRVETAQAQVQNARNRRMAIAQARMAQAANQANTPGALQASSALTGVQSGISTQLGVNFGAQNQNIGSQQAAFNFRQSASNTLASGQRRANLWQTFGQLGQMGASAFGGAAPQQTPSTANAWASNTP